MKFHLEGLQSNQIEVLKQMSPFMHEGGFYLAACIIIPEDCELNHPTRINVDIPSSKGC